MAETVRLKLPLMSASQAQKHVTHNEAITMLDLLVGVIPVLDRSLAAAPAASDGAVYILGGAGTGGWAGYSAGDLALMIDGSWRRVLPSVGMVATIAAEGGMQIVWTGSSWITLGTTLGRNAKSATTSRASDATLASDPDLQFTMAAGKTYAIKLKVFFTAPATPGLKFALVGPASPTRVQVERRVRAPGGTIETIAGDDVYTASTAIAGNATTHGYLSMDIVVENGANGGTFAFQWAQNAANANACAVRAGSTLEWAVL